MFSVHRSLFSTLSPSEALALDVVAQLRAAGHESYVVGGAVRDRLLGRRPGEADVATAALPEQVQALFPRTLAIGAAFGVIVVVTPAAQVEVATFRQDREYRDGRRPEGVRFATAREDAERRDFTVNALFFDPVTEQVLDFVGGLEDLQRGRLRCIGDPATRFAEDYLRLLRAARFAASLDFALDAGAQAAMRNLAPRLAAISAERVCAELTKMLLGPDPAQALALLADCGLLAVILPELAALRGVEQPRQWHPEGDVWTHTLLLLRGLRAPSPALAWSALLHDIGKPATQAPNGRGENSFHGHENVGSGMARAVLSRLRASRQLQDDVAHMVGNHMAFKDVPHMRPATLRRLLGAPTFADELELHRLDCRAASGNLDNYVFLLDRLHELGQTPPLPEPLLRGRDLVAAGVPPGPRLGAWLRELRELQLEGCLGTRAEAEAWLQSKLTG